MKAFFCVQRKWGTFGSLSFSFFPSYRFYFHFIEEEILPHFYIDKGWMNITQFFLLPFCFLFWSEMIYESYLIIGIWQKSLKLFYLCYYFSSLFRGTIWIELIKYLKLVQFVKNVANFIGWNWDAFRKKVVWGDGLGLTI